MVTTSRSTILLRFFRFRGFGWPSIVAQEVETPFWQLVADLRWKNVDHDMKEAIDLRDTDGRDPSFYAAKALESAIKIISNENQLSTGKERGAHAYLIAMIFCDTNELFWLVLRLKRAQCFGRGTTRPW
jgi:hypothetical protein